MPGGICVLDVNDAGKVIGMLSFRTGTRRQCINRKTGEKFWTPIPYLFVPDGAVGSSAGPGMSRWAGGFAISAGQQHSGAVVERG